MILFKVILVIFLHYTWIIPVFCTDQDLLKIPRNRFPVTLRRKLSHHGGSEGGSSEGVFGARIVNNGTNAKSESSGSGRVSQNPVVRASVVDYGAHGGNSQVSSATTLRPTPSYVRPPPSLVPRPTESVLQVSASTTTAPVVIPIVTVAPAATTSVPSTFVPIVEPITTASVTQIPTVVESSTALITDGEEEDDEFKSRMGLPAPTKSTLKAIFGSKRPAAVGDTAASARIGLADSALTSRMGSRAMKYDEDTNVVTDFVFSDIKCYRTKNREFFGASIYMKRGYHVPYIRDRPQDPLTSSDCKMERLETPNGYRMSVTDLRGCGVEQCGDSLCLTMVFPRVPTLALADDEVTTIKCLPQKSSISETRTISFAGDSMESRRSSSTVEGGGQDFAAEVGVFRQNPGTSNGLFVKRVNSGGVVQLGEPLQLRSVVRGGDGWSHSKLTDVKVWRMRENYGTTPEKMNPNDASEVITLVDSEGCRNPEYDVIAESHPIRDPRNNLVHHFTFRAFLFRGQRANEPLIITSKVMACQEAAECRLSECGSSRGAADPNVSRYRRSSPVEHHNASSAIIQDFDTQLSLRVVGLRDHPASLTEKDLADPAIASDGLPATFTCTEKMGFAAAGGSCVTLFVLGLAFSLICYHVKNTRKQQDANNNNGRAHDTESKVSPPSEFARKSGPNKPLPPPPIEYDPVAPPNVFLPPPAKSPSETRSDGKLRPSNNLNCEYESIRGRKKSSSRPKDDDVVIVYCCDNKKRKHGTNSAPSSLRSKRRTQREKIQDRFRQNIKQTSDDTEESDGFYEKRTPRTVREVKRSNHKQQRRMSIRRRLSSFYREMNGNRPHRSFPARISVKNLHGGLRRGNKFYYASASNSQDHYSDGLSAGLSSDSDSAYAGSECSKHKDRRSCGDKCRWVVSRTGQLNQSIDRPGVSISGKKNVGEAEEEAIYGILGQPLSSPSKQQPQPERKATHLVSTSENSTKIIILPETNV